MGAGAGKGPAYGMPANPRVEYAEKRSKKLDESLVIDAPALVDLGHGTVRYRDDKKIPQQEDIKTGYFYHARLDDYSEDASEMHQDEFKFKYVYKGPKSARGKSLFYIYGIGMNATDQKLETKKPYKPKGKGYVWPSSYKNPNHFYYDLKLMIQDSEMSDSEDEVEDVGSKVNPDLIRLRLNDCDTCGDVKKRVAFQLLIPSSIVHVCHRDVELVDGDNIGRLRAPEEGEFQKFSVEMYRI